MQRRENYRYVDMDLHKDTHTAVLVNCWTKSWMQWLSKTSLASLIDWQRRLIKQH
jgi:hypothetical protein